jgi:hypothetical protein
MTTDNLFHSKIRPAVLYITLAICALGSAVYTGVGHAEGKNYYREEWNLPDFYPRGFDGYGRIEQIEKNNIVITDTALKLSPGARFCTPHSRRASRTAFAAGSLVAYILNDKREIESLWLIE